MTEKLCMTNNFVKFAKFDTVQLLQQHDDQHPSWHQILKFSIFQLLTTNFCQTQTLSNILLITQFQFWKLELQSLNMSKCDRHFLTNFAIMLNFDTPHDQSLEKSEKVVSTGQKTHFLTPPQRAGFGGSKWLKNTLF